jgi:hypothetical protein
MGHRPPSHAVSHHVAQPVEHFPQTVLALSGGLGQQCQVRDNESTFFIADIGRICDAGLHPCKTGAPAGP